MNVLEALKQFISSELMPDPNGLSLEDNAALIEEGIIDSLGILKLLAFVEERFSVCLSDDELIPENFETPVAISDLIQNKMNSSLVA